MKQREKAFSAVLVAALALSAAVASVALASSHTFDSEIEDTFITGAAVSAKQVFVAVPGSGEAIECGVVGIKHTNNEKGEEVVNDGTLLGTKKETAVYTAEKLNVRFTYEGCEYVKHKGEKNEERGVAYVEMGECYYAFENVTDETNHASVHIQCPKGGRIHVTVTATKAACMTIPEQTVSGVNYNNTNLGGGASRDFDITMTMKNTTTETEGFLCGGAKKHTEGTYGGEVTISATNKNVGGSQIGIWVT
jgi:hypothetical protein